MKKENLITLMVIVFFFLYLQTPKYLRDIFLYSSLIIFCVLMLFRKMQNKRVATKNPSDTELSKEKLIVDEPEISVEKKQTVFHKILLFVLRIFWILWVSVLFSIFIKFQIKREFFEFSDEDSLLFFKYTFVTLVICFFFVRKNILILKIIFDTLFLCCIIFINILLILSACAVFPSSGSVGQGLFILIFPVMICILMTISQGVLRVGNYLFKFSFYSRKGINKK